jgi:hypothetical protein
VCERSPSSITVTKVFVPYFRSAIIAEFGTAIDVLGNALETEVVDLERWYAGVAQLDCARALLDSVGICSGPAGDSDVVLDVTPAHAARMIVEALQVVYTSELQRFTSASADRVHLPLRDIPELGRFADRTERRLTSAVARSEPILSKLEKRTPRITRTTK